MRNPHMRNPHMRTRLRLPCDGAAACFADGVCGVVEVPPLRLAITLRGFAGEEEEEDDSVRAEAIKLLGWWERCACPWRRLLAQEASLEGKEDTPPL